MSAPTLELPAAVVPGPADAQPIPVVRRLADALARERIPYCHWKSNAHLMDSAQGTTDLDVLVDRAHAQSLAIVLGRTGFKRFAAVPWLAYPAVEDYLALDAASGRLVHLHLHYELTLGERHLKGYHLPWEAHLLASRRLDPTTGLYVVDATLELLLLLVRSALKLRARDRLVAGLRGGAPDPDVQREYHWLIMRASMGELPSLTLRLLGSHAAELVRSLGVTELTAAWLFAFARCAREELRGCRTFGASEARVRRALRELRVMVGAVDRRWVRSTHRRVRTNPRGGVVVALIGCDGSGKSTLAEATASWLSWKLDTTPLYLGSGDGPASPLRWPLLVALRAARSARRWYARRRHTDPDAAATGWTVSRTVWALVLAREKRHKLRQTVRARNRGIVVICDRYPQAQVPGVNDGPLLSRWRDHPWAVVRSVVRWEAAPYEWAARHPPDLVVKLLVSPEVTRRRKPAMRPDDVARRVAVVRGLTYPSPAKVVEVDADAPLERVIQQVRRAVWDRL
jgi:hypothetical protein